MVAMLPRWEVPSSPFVARGRLVLPGITHPTVLVHLVHLLDLVVVHLLELHGSDEQLHQPRPWVLLRPMVLSSPILQVQPNPVTPLIILLCIFLPLLLTAQWMSGEFLILCLLLHLGHSGDFGNAPKMVGKISKSVMQLISIGFWNWF